MLLTPYNGLSFFSFSLLSKIPGLVHGVTTKQGGVSRPPFGGLNLGLGREQAALTRQNMELVRRALGLSDLASVRQVHGDKAVRINGGEPNPAAQADGLMTDRPGVGLLIKQADCQALVLVAPGRAVGNFHVGWRGNVAGFPQKAVSLFCAEFGLEPAGLLAAVSPSLGPCCGEFVNYREELPPEFWPFMVSPNHFDLWAVTKSQLVSAGVLPENIELSGLCTKCGQEFYSHRRGEPGRFGTVVALAG